MSLKLIYQTKQKLQKLQIKNTTFRYEYKSLCGNVLSNLNFKTTFLPTKFCQPQRKKWNAKRKGYRAKEYKSNAF